MVRRFYVHNYRCLENFELSLANQPSVLLIGKNGSGKSTVRFAFELLSKIARGTNRVRELIDAKDMARGRSDAPVRFEIEVELTSKLFQYVVAFELPPGFRELRIAEERLICEGQPVFHRETSQVRLLRSANSQAAEFRIDWHLAGLPIIQVGFANDPLSVFKEWLSRSLILNPAPSLIIGDSNGETLQPQVDVRDFGAWFSGVIAHTPAAYSFIDSYLKPVMPDLKDIRNPMVGKDFRSLSVQFANRDESLSVAFEDLSDGEKCFMISALALAANQSYGPLLCFWDEPDSYLSLSEIGHFVLSLRREFQRTGQFIATSHNPEAIRSFSDENTLVLFRESHLEPTRVRALGEMGVHGDLVGALIRGDVG